MNYYVNADELTPFFYGGVDSATFNLYLTDLGDLYNSFERDIEFVEVAGRDGDLLIDNKRKKSKEVTLTGFIDMEQNNVPMPTLAKAIEDWLQGEVKYKELIVENKTYNAICINQISIKEVMEQLGEIQIKFRIQPPKTKG